MSVHRCSLLRENPALFSCLEEKCLIPLVITVALFHTFSESSTHFGHLGMAKPACTVEGTLSDW